MIPLLYALFTASGAAGLMYESIWSRYLGLFVGHSAYAQIIVLVIFLGGMSLGAFVVGRRSAHLADPLRWYAAVELGAGILGLLFHPVFGGVTDFAYATLFPALPAGGAVVVAKWSLAALLILPQSVLLGATFPLMSAGVVRREPEAPGRVLALLYFTNSLGAAGGVLLAGYWLLGAFGLPGTLTVAALVNAAVAVLAFVVATGTPLVPTPAATAPSAPDVTPASRTLLRGLLVVAFGTAVASFVYEIAWLRMLSLVLGSATHSFEIMLSAFIFGLAAGAWWIRERADRLRDPIRTLGLVQWVMGSLAIATLPIYLKSFEWMAMLLDGLDTTSRGYTLFSVARYAFCLAVMLPATFCAGMTLPLITRTLFVRGAGAHQGGEDAIGRVYAVNTLGSIVGAALAGLVLMPVLGLKWLLVAGAAIDVALGFYLLLDAHRLSATRSAPAGERSVTLAAALITLVVLLTTAVSVPFQPAVLTSGVYRYARVSEPERLLVPFYRDGRTATVSVRRVKGTGMLSLATNGKPDASLSLSWIHPDPRDTTRRRIDGDQVTQALLPLLALAHVPDARRAAVIGEGSGMTSHLLLASPRLAQLATIDIEPEMIRASHEFYPANRRVFDDPRSHFVIDDAKAYFAAARQPFDVIVSEPSNPWVSGVSGLFTDEFYRRVRGWLAPGGVFGQWLHLYEIDDPLVLDVLAAVHRNFASYDVYLVSSADIFVVASTAPRLPTPDWRVLALPGIASDLRRTLPLDSATLVGARLLDRAALAPLLDRWMPINSDYRPVLDLDAERARYMRRSALGFRTLPSGAFDPVSALRGWRAGFGASPQSAVDLPRPDALARGTAVRLAWARLAARAPGDTVGASAIVATLTHDTTAVRDALYRRAAYENVLASGRAPVDWSRFVAHALDVADDLHGGTAGAVDTAFYDRLFGYLAAQHAPAGATAAAHLAHGLSAWDWRESADAADTLAELQRRGARWVSPDMLVDGGVVAALRLGDAARARRLLDGAWQYTKRPSDDLRALLYPAWIYEAALAERSGGRRVSAPAAHAGR